MILTSAGSKIDSPKHYDEKNTYINYYDVISREQKSNQQQIHRNIATKRILVVDDEYDVSLVIRLVLEESGFKVDSFTDASEALENFTTGLYDLVILDIKMPAMSGFSLHKKIRELDDKVTICFLTAADEVYYEILKRRHHNIDGTCVIRKPVDNDSLLRRIRSIF
jgi:two-component system alkaline phosphatase synthesis response regulator PhoP/two-component system response regulator ResD